MPDSTASLPDPADAADEPEQPAATAAPPMPLGCLRQATTQTPAAAIVPQFICKAKVCPTTCRHKRSQDAT